MSAEDFTALGLLSLLVWFVYWLGREIGKHQQQALWRDHMEKCNRYAHAVDDLDKWCGHQSPHARLIARHLRALGEGLGLNAGTPVGDEACQIGGLREQLKRLDAARKQGANMTEPTLTCPECGSDRVTTAHIQTFMVNTGEHWCHSVKTRDPDSPATCLDCWWKGERKDLKEANHD